MSLNLLTPMISIRATSFYSAISKAKLGREGLETLEQLQERVEGLLGPITPELMEWSTGTESRDWIK
jgi:hypothetical protein